MTVSLEFRHVSYAYQRRDVVRDVSFEVGAGEIVCLLGPSGCGKTTCLRIAAGLERLTRGEVRIAGEMVAAKGIHLPPEHRGVGLVLQDFALFPHMTVADNVTFGLARVSRAERDARLRALMQAVGLTGYESAWPHQLSGGQQQRVALARALAPDPDIMLMDEPFSGLDVTLRADVREAALSTLKSRRVPTLIVTHDPDEALALADRIIIMRAGEIVQAGYPEDLYLHPADPFVMTFFGRPNHIEARVENGRAATPFGVLPTPGLNDGVVVDIYFRGGALKPVPDGQGCRAQVCDARLLGPVQRIRLKIAGAGAYLEMLLARKDALEVGDLIDIAADLEDFRIFPRNRVSVDEI